MQQWKDRKVLVLGLGGFALSVWWTHASHATAFFLTPARFWELMLGAMLAVGPGVPGGKRLRQAMSLVGLMLIGWSIFTFGNGTQVPGPMAALPCLGAALCIAGNRDGDTVVARLLSWRPIVFVGLISYSLYLWHWPVIVLMKGVLAVSTLSPASVPTTDHRSIRADWCSSIQ